MVNKVIETDTDDLLYVMKPSQLVNIWWLLLFLSLITIGIITQMYWFGIITGIIWFSKWLIVKCWSFRFHEKTIAERKGVFSVLTREIHYFRIKSVRHHEPLLLRIFGLSNVVLVTSDPLIPMLRLYGIRYGSDVISAIKEEVSIWRRERTVKEQDIHPLM